MSLFVCCRWPLSNDLICAPFSFLSPVIFKPSQGKSLWDLILRSLEWQTLHHTHSSKRRSLKMGARACGLFLVEMCEHDLNGVAEAKRIRLQVFRRLNQRSRADRPRAQRKSQKHHLETRYTELDRSSERSGSGQMYVEISQKITIRRKQSMAQF